MTPGARLAAAAEILTEIFARKAAADRTLAGWGKAHRFAGSKDRAAIAERVYAVLRRRNECAFRMQSEDVRALVIGSLAVGDGLSADQIDALCTDGTHALGALTAEERTRVGDVQVPGEPWLRGNYPRWLHDAFVQVFGDALEAEMAALSGRAPLDLRVNALKATRTRVLRELGEASIVAEPLAAVPSGLRVAAGADAKVTALAAYREGRVEIQDEASQRAVLFARAKAGDLVIDLAAGAGGKSLALAALMGNRGRVVACDVEPARLRQMEPRVERAGASIVEIAGDPYGGAVPSDADLVFVDAPCSGTGTWRRNPESKWTLDPARLATYEAAQRRLLDRAAQLVTADGAIVYAVCSVLPAETEGQMTAFLARHGGWRCTSRELLTPHRSQTDGFFVARLTRMASHG
jgi:16S rRNA (cytosine967-C5)-methyltransferase